MTYEDFWHRLTARYDTSEAKAIARWVLDMRFGLSLTDILCGKVTQLSADDQGELEKIALRLEKSEPVQYVLGTADFCGRQFRVAPGVLIPRPETAELCLWILEDTGHSDAVSILDIGTGSGCIAITLAAELPDSMVTGWDISDAALSIARENAELLGVSVTLEQRDILKPPASNSKPQNAYDVIVSNPPYIKPEERYGMEHNVLDYEPAIALFAPADNPTVFYQRIADYAIEALKPGGRLYFELNPQTALSVADYLTHAGFGQIEMRQDQYGKLRFLKATKI